MKTDLDSLMQAENIDAMLVVGPGFHNPPMVYLTGGAHLTQANLIKRRGADPVLFYNPMERDEAARTGLRTRNFEEFSLRELIKELNGDVLQATAVRLQRMLAGEGITSGRVAIFGSGDAGASYAVFSALQQLMPDITLVGQTGGSMLMRAMATKEPAEVERIRRMGKITTEVVGETADFLTSHATKDEVLVKADGTPLTIGDVKKRINLWLAERGAENPEGTIFAIGRDAGVPHSSGINTDLLRLGQTIVYDIFPCEAGGGYYYDFTRTWSLGYATDEAQALYDQVLSVYRQIMSELRMGELCKPYQERTCELFEAMGHPTLRSDPKTESGYVHSLGHGLGLHVHELPMFGTNATEFDRLYPGAIVTIEPGLYYPERGMGVRLEDTVHVCADGQMEVLAEFPMELVLPMKG
jgi:Xaa-Pro aminopeptidase